MTEEDLLDHLPEDYGTGKAVKDDRAAALLKKHPGKWLRVRDCATRQRAQSSAHRVRAGRITAFRRGFHAEAITTKTSEHQVWATYRPGLAEGPKRELL